MRTKINKSDITLKTNGSSYAVYIISPGGYAYDEALDVKKQIEKVCTK